MSQENVELVLRAYRSPDVNVAALVRDDRSWAAWISELAPLFHHDVGSIWPGFPGAARTFTGIQGTRAALVDWTIRWATYRSEVEEAIECGEHVVLVAPSFGRPPGSAREIRLEGANLWTVRDGKIAQVYTSTTADVLGLVAVSVYAMSRMRNSVDRGGAHPCDHAGCS
jgi:ketosteroid isomerase-like protein